MQYRLNFLVEGVMSLYWLGWNLLPLLVLYNDRQSVAGWDQSSALVVIGWFVILRGILEGAINPSLTDVVERLRTGSFDYVLLKPADAQFLVSTSRFVPWRLVDVAGGVGIIVWAFVRLGHAPTPADIAVAAGLLVAACLAMYALWIMIVCAAFWVVRLDNLAFLLTAVFDAARWPIQVFRGAWRVLFTFVIPLALMTTYPAMALLGTLHGRTALACLGGALAMSLAARLAWRAALRNYTSASS
ncbi:MAG: ABC-2 family transporter protein [Kofleriaceae bacterium]|nr:ABC-2 family transporter protein [Myxococcales bacterium]MCB9559242.1 ABC-2 family transporter protein [Kofleriaceae bacterium]